MVVTKNALIDKTGRFERLFRNFFGNSFLFSKSDALWKAKRKATAHAFYKDRLSFILEDLKGLIAAQQNCWLAQI